ncbi:MAG TPA: hypothetical protein VNT58_10920 [Gaiellaceae bacterium]|nr:hypothetical protein [Gaiellaceae bacterium]
MRLSGQESRMHLTRMLDGAFYGSRASIVDKLGRPITRHTPLSHRTLQRAFAALFLFWSSRRVFRALRAGLRG